MTAINTKRSMRVFELTGLFGLLVVAGGLVFWATTTSIQGAIIAQGLTVVESHSKKVQHNEGGIIARIAVKNGDEVKAGQALIYLDETESRANLAIIDGALDELTARKARLTALRDDKSSISFPERLTGKKQDKQIAALIAGQTRLLNVQRASSNGRRDQLLSRIEQLNEEIAGLKSQRQSTNGQVDLITKELEKLGDLFKKGLVPASRMLALRREKTRLEGQKGEFVGRIAKARNRIAETRLQIIQINDDERVKTLSELREIEAKLIETRERRIAIAARLKRTIIRAPQSGFVHQLAVHTIGGVISPGEAVMFIVPVLDDLVVEARIDPNDIDQVFAGQHATVRFPAFNQRTTPQVDAAIIQISPDLTQPTDNSAPYFAIRLRLKKGERERLGKTNKLIPGMPAETFLQTNARSPISFLIQPLTDQITRAFREE